MRAVTRGGFRVTSLGDGQRGQAGAWKCRLVTAPMGVQGTLQHAPGCTPAPASFT